MVDEARVGAGPGPGCSADGVWRRRPRQPVIVHTDQGSQYGSDDAVRFYKDHGLIPSMSLRGNCFDNAVVESFFSSLKKERIRRRISRLRREAREDVFDYIEIFYNRTRRHSHLGQATLSRIEDRPWLVKSRQPLLDKSLPHRTFWQIFRLSKLAREARCNVLFVPGGSSACNFQPTVTMSRNLLPFEWQELRRYGWSFITLKMMLLRWTQSRSFRHANGLIFLTQYARKVVMRIIKPSPGKTTVVPHGINDRFFRPPHEQLSIDRYSVYRPFQMLYVSIVDMYKHQWMVAQAVTWLRQAGLPVRMDLVGPAYPPALKRLRQTLDRIDPDGECVRYSGAVPHPELHVRYANADLCVFASSCENMPNILLEAMAAGLPIACSNRGPMPEMFGDGGVYFDPENPRDIARALRELIDSPELRKEKARASFERAQAYSWARCARETFGFLAEIASAAAAGSLPDHGS